MNDDVQSWLLAQLGPDTDLPDLLRRYERLRSARSVALEVLHERIAAIVAEPLKVTVNGVVTIDNSANVTALERRAAQLHTDPAPDDPATGGDNVVATILLRARPRR
ncbi:hypothetical protein ACFYVL_14135 [Streptomyces sp. NPDC004111]|uniref:hypothetical protein n=1 Tax=Streptomyces sp. NPDC004111 TaxID=3364690 RepID=UPI0036BC11E1